MVNSRKKTCGKSRREAPTPLPLFSIDDFPESVPAAGWRNGTSLNNAGENGNYWSSTPNESNTQNAYNLNFNSSNQNVNWNNRNNGQSVRPVSELTSESGITDESRHFSISREQLLKDLYYAYKCARKHKRNRSYQLKFEFNLEENLIELRNELISGTYRPYPSSCFIIHDPKMREVFAANFRDRIVHHLFYNYTHRLFERSFIYDSYSCIKKRGTHFGISRLRHHILSVSKGFSRPCYVLKIDIKGYFMSINRTKLLEQCRAILHKMKHRQSEIKGKTWGMLLDYSFIDYLLVSIINSNPIEGCNVIGKMEDWNNLPSNKSLFCAHENCGLPIGNLSSQLFSNIYMNQFDQYVKRVLKCKHYGRYVDDSYIVHENKIVLRKLIPVISQFLQEQLELYVNPDKIRICNAKWGVDFLGAYIKPFRTYVSTNSLRRIKRNLKLLPNSNVEKIHSSINSYLGVLSHYNSYYLRRILFGMNGNVWKHYGDFSNDWLLFRTISSLNPPISSIIPKSMVSQ